MISENRNIGRTAASAAKCWRKNVLRNVFALFAAAVTALGCGWNLYEDHSVRFNSERTGRAFYRLPPLPIHYDAVKGKEISTRELENFALDEDRSEEEKPKDPQADAYSAAGAAVDSGRLSDARQLLEKYVELSDMPNESETAESEQQKQRNTAFDLLDSLSALRQGADPDAVRAYMVARYIYDGAAEQDLDKLRMEWRDRHLDDNWAYLQAAKLNAAGSNAEALEAFQSHAAKYPHSEKIEAVQYMIAKLTMQQSYSFINTNCGIMGKTAYEEVIDPATIEPEDKCQDENWDAAIKAFQKLIRNNPKGRYHNDARGWLAFLYKRGGQRAKALAVYYSLLGDAADRTARLKAKRSLERIGHEYDDATLDEVEGTIAGDPQAGLAYSYHRIYNQAIDLSYAAPENWCCSGVEQRRERQEEDERVSALHKAGDHELQRVAKFATAMIKRYPRSQVSGDFVLRTAEADLELQKFQDALNLSEKALSLGIGGDARSEGLWVKGSSEHHLKQLRAARATFTQLINEFPHHKLTEGAQRLLAMTAEDQDDLETALELYLKLNYKDDVAYFIDVLMPTNRLAKFVHAQRNTSQFDQLLYALGVRYMRDGRWNEARETLGRVHTETGTDEYLRSDKNATWYFPKEPIFDYYNSNEATYIKTSWVVQDLKTIDILEHYEKAVETSEGDEATAEAMYQLASCLFESDDLVFYNPIAWHGARSGLLSQLIFTDHTRLPNESQIIFEHLQKHEPWARAIPIYQEIAARFPKTKTARDALYSSAVAHERLVERVAPWSEIYKRGLFAGSRIVTYQDVRNSYPAYQFPRGTYGWQPSTRTVNGGPGWDPKPKPPPRLSITQRIERKVEKYGGLFMTRISPKIEEAADDGISFVRGCIYGLIIIVAMFIAGYGAVVAVHFRTLKGTATVAALEPIHVLERLPATESRIEKVIDDA